MASHRRTRTRPRRAGRTYVDRRLQRWVRARRRRIREAFVRVGKAAVHNWKTYRVSPTVQQTGDLIHGARKTQARAKRQGSNPRQAPRTTSGRKPTMSTATASANGAGRRAPTPEAEQARRALRELAAREPLNAGEILNDMRGASLVGVAFGAALLDYAETLAGMGCDGKRVVGPLTEISIRAAELGGDLAKLARTFYTVYRGDVEQSENGVKPMRYPAAA